MRPPFDPFVKSYPQEWVAHTEEQYIQLAVHHASDIQRLSQLRQSLRERMLASPLCDAPAFVTRLEGVYRQLWHRYVATATTAAKAKAAAEAAGAAACDGSVGHGAGSMEGVEEGGCEERQQLGAGEKEGAVTGVTGAGPQGASRPPSPQTPQVAGEGEGEQ